VILRARGRGTTKDLDKVGTPHFAQFVPLEDDQIGFFAVYDGSFEKYIADWRSGGFRAFAFRGIRRRLPYRSTDRVDQLTRWKWLAQIRNASCRDSLPLDIFTVDRGHEYDWKLGSAGRKAVRQLDAGNATQIDIEQEAACLGRGGVLEECLGRCIGLGEESVRAQ
jgi:hypothetical protein